MASTKRVGVTSFTIDGAAMDLVGSVEYTLNTIKRESLSGMSGVHGFKEMPVPGKLSCTIRDSNTLSIADFENMTSVTIAVEQGNGKQIVGTACWTVEAQDVSADEATIKLTFETASLVEI